MTPRLFDAKGAPTRVPFVGHVPAFSADPLRLLTSLAREHGGLAPIDLGPLKGYVVSEPALLSEVFVSRRKLYTRKTRVYEALAEFIGRGILTSEGEDWRVHRRIVQPAFHKRRLESFATQIAAITAEELDRVAAREGATVDVSDALMRLTLRIVGEVLLGTETTELASRVGAAVSETQRWVERVTSELVAVPRWVPTPRNRAFHRLRGTLDDITYAIIDARERSGERGDDAISMLLDARYEDGGPVSRERIRNEVLTLLAAGHETTSSALTYAVARLSRHPHVARALMDEVDRVLGDRVPTFDDVPKLVYTRWVFDETLRLHPPAWVTGRLALEPHELGGVSIARGDMLLLSPYVTHRRPDLWENPEGFDPERWRALGERGALAPFAFLPFGGGTRKCVGEAFAYLEATLVLAMLAQRCRLELVAGEPIRPLAQITLGTRDPVRVVVRRRPPREAARPEIAPRA